jgi:hypothetical protein
VARIVELIFGILSGLSQIVGRGSAKSVFLAIDHEAVMVGSPVCHTEAIVLGAQVYAHLSGGLLWPENANLRFAPMSRIRVLCSETRSVNDVSTLVSFSHPKHKLRSELIGQ